MKQFIFFILLILPTSLLAQDLKMDLVAMGKAYQSLDDFEITIEMLHYSESTDESYSIKQQAVVGKIASNYYHEYDDWKMLLEDGESLVIYPQKKIMIYASGKADNIEESPMQQMDLEKLDQALEQSDKVEFRGEKNGEKHYLVYDANGSIMKMSIRIDQKTNLLSGIEYWYHPSFSSDIARTKVSYKTNMNPKFDKLKYSISNYVQPESGAAELTKAYQGFELIHNKIEN